MPSPISKRPGDWRMREARTLKSEYQRGTIDPTKEDPTVLRILDHTDGPGDPEIEQAITLYVDYNPCARSILDDLSCGESAASLSAIHNVSEGVILLLKELYDDQPQVGSKEIQAISRARTLSPGDRKRYLMRRKYGRYADIFTEGAAAISSGLGSKDILDMVRHALAQSYMIATSADQVDLDSGEQKTILAYNGVMVNLIKLLNELEASNSDSNAILERMAAFTEKIPKDVPKVPAIEEMEGTSEDGFNLAPLDDVKDTDE